MKKPRKPRIEQTGRLLFSVRSNSRKRLRHTVDLEGFERYPCICNCEAWKYNVDRPVCRHVIMCINYVLQPFRFHRKDREAIKDACVWGLQMGLPFIQALGSCVLRHQFDQIESRKPQRKKKRHAKTKPAFQTR